MSEILLYGGIYSFSARDYITEFEAAKSKPKITVRVNSGGGDVYYGYGMIAKTQEYKGELNVKVDGVAASMAAFFLLFANNVEALDVSEFMFHRADMYIASPTDQAWLDQTNNILKAKMLSKFDPLIFETTTGTSIEKMFDPTQRVDITLNAEQALKIGLINKITTLTVADATRIAAMSPRELPRAVATLIEAATPPASQKVTKSKPNMTLAEFQTQHPDVYAQAVTVGADAERDRAGAYLEFADVDLVAAKAGIESGKVMSTKDIAAFSRKAFQSSATAEAAATTAATTTTAQVVPEAAAPTAVDTFLAEVNSDLKKS